MSDLYQVLAKYSVQAPRFGAKDPSDAGASPELQTTNDDLRRDLKSISDKNRSLFLICVAMVLVLFIGSCWLVLKYLQNPSFIKSVFAVTGISFLGLLSQMVRLWKGKVISDMILVLAGSLKPGDIRPLLEILLRSLK
jgi:hypothetical protein